MSALLDPSCNRNSAVFLAAALTLAMVSLFIIMQFGMLPGLLAALAAFLMTSALSSLIETRCSLPFVQSRAAAIAATVVILGPIVLLAVAGVEGSKALALAVQNFTGLRDHLLQVVLGWRDRLPAGIAEMIPSNSTDLQTLVSTTLQNRVSTIAGVGKTWFSGLLLVIVGLVIGSLIAVASRVPCKSAAPLASAIRERAKNLSVTFKTIVVAQFWIAAVNATLTALFLFLVLPVTLDVTIPYSGWLVLFTFVAGMLPIVGNLLCNVVLTLAGLGVSPLVGAVCLAFLIAIHKLEYFINAKVIGTSIQTAAWEMLVAMFVFESLFGVPGLVAAPLYYAYLKAELNKLGWV